MTVQQQRAREWATFFTQKSPEKVTQAPKGARTLIIEGRSLLRHWVHATAEPFSARQFALDFDTHVNTLAGSLHAHRMVVTLDAPSLIIHARWPMGPEDNKLHNVEGIAYYLLSRDSSPVEKHLRHLLYDITPLEWQLRRLVTEVLINTKRFSIQEMEIRGALMDYVDDTRDLWVYSTRDTEALYNTDPVRYALDTERYLMRVYRSPASVSHNFSDPDRIDALSMAIRAIPLDGSVTVVESHDPEALAALLCMMRGLKTKKERQDCCVYLHWFDTYWFNVSELYIHLNTDLKIQCAPHVIHPGVSWLGAFLASTSPAVEIPEHEGSVALTLDTLALFTAHAGVLPRRACIVQNTNSIETCLLSESIELYLDSGEKDPKKVRVFLDRVLAAHNELDELQWIIYSLHVAQRCFVARLGKEHPPPWPTRSLDGNTELIHPLSYIHALFDSLGEYARRVQDLKRPSTYAAHVVRVKRLAWVMDHWVSVRVNEGTVTRAATRDAINEDTWQKQAANGWKTNAVFWGGSYQTGCVTFLPVSEMFGAV